MKYYGNIGFAETVETSPGVYTEQIVERTYYGDVLEYGRNLQSTNDGVNDNLRITNQLSIVADDKVYGNIGAIRYAEFMGVKWKVSTVRLNSPRLLLTLGDEWNGPTA